MSENGFWRTLGKQMRVNDAWREATRHEDKLNLGICDVSFVSNAGAHGWIELKKVADWPARENTLIRVPHYTEHQRLFLKKKGEAGGNTWLLIKIGRDVLIFDWKTAQTVGFWCKAEMKEYCRAEWVGKMNYVELGCVLDRGC